MLGKLGMCSLALALYFVELLDMTEAIVVGMAIFLFMCWIENGKPRRVAYYNYAAKAIIGWYVFVLIFCALIGWGEWTELAFGAQLIAAWIGGLYQASLFHQ